ncbi:MAG: iron-containing alcohol dehydrogenase [Candidatus Jordarchaeum sp.]|uniref:iron-containing alcohol dehydrogenase n=1 Tax=Candidatus Jordarchaeum sp. TaxID=2823881 RepID=UPI0040494A4B
MSLPIRIPIIYSGVGSLEQLRYFTEKRILIVTDKTIRQMVGDKLSDYFKDKEVKIYDEVEPDPKDTIMIKGGDFAREFKPELIIGIGGGSAMDTAKAMYFLYGQPSLKLYDMNVGIPYNLSEKSKLVLIPTTSGTGSEHTPGLVTTNTETGQKISLASFEIVPQAVILDPTLVLSMPKKLTISTGLDALTQAIESASGKMGSDFTQALNLYAIKILFEYLPKAAGEGAGDINVRAKVHYAASMAGIAFGHSGLGIAHSFGHALGGAFHVPHGITVGVMLPYAIEFNKPECEEKYVEILECLKITGIKDPTAKLSSMVKDLLKKLDTPLSIKGLGISQKDWEQNFEKLVNWTKGDILTLINPRMASEEQVRKIFQYAYEGKTIDF